MAVQTEKRVIGGRTYQVTQLTALKARALFVRLIKLIGPMAAALLGSGNPSAFLSMEGADLGPMIIAFTERLTEDELDFFCSILGESSAVIGDNGQAQMLARNIIDIEFAGRLMDLFKWLAFALEVNFADFLSATRSIPVARSMAPGSGPLQSQALSTGMSGAS